MSTRLQSLRSRATISLAISLLPLSLFSLSSCSLSSAAGPTSRAVNRAGSQGVDSNVQIIDVTDAVARRVIASSRPAMFSDVLGDVYQNGNMIGRGDVLDISIWEAPPAVLFGSVGSDSRSSPMANSVARNTSLPEQMVDQNGQIQIPFIGTIAAAGRTPGAIARTIKERLEAKAHEPQVIVRLSQNAAANVTIMGDVANSTRMPLTAKGERLLDALASAGGVKQPVGKMTIQVTRENTVVSLPLEMVIRDPRQNIRLKSDDIVTALFQPYSFTALGAAGTNAEIPFEGTGLSLIQALGRVGGLNDTRADARGVFIFRLEDPAALDPAMRSENHLTADGKIPVIYKVDMRNPSTLFAAQSFPIRNKDVLYVSNAPLADFQKFLNIISSVVYPITNVNAVLNNKN